MTRTRIRGFSLGLRIPEQGKMFVEWFELQKKGGKTLIEKSKTRRMWGYPTSVFHPKGRLASHQMNKTRELERDTKGEEENLGIGEKSNLVLGCAASANRKEGHRLEI